MAAQPKPIIQVKNLIKDFPYAGALKKGFMRAVNDVSYDLVPGRALAIVGESGSGKSTGARMLSLLYPKTSGDLLFEGQEISNFRGSEIQQYRQNVQMIFQDPYGSLNPVHTIFHHLARPLSIHKKVKGGKKELTDRVHSLLEEVGLTPAIETAQKHPFQLSGGQRQRVCVAKTLAIGARVVLADEPTSALDVSIRLGILNLMQTMKTERNVAFMYITHDIATARYFAETIGVMYVGHMVEWGSTEEVVFHSQHPYTQLLISAVPDPSKKAEAAAAAIANESKTKADIPMWTPDSRGCPFENRCPYAKPKCAEAMPGVTKLAKDHFVRCYLHEK